MLFLRKYEYVKKPRTLVGYAPPKEATDPPGPLWDDLRDFLRYSRARYHKEQINP